MSESRKPRDLGLGLPTLQKTPAQRLEEAIEKIELPLPAVSSLVQEYIKTLHSRDAVAAEGFEQRFLRDAIFKEKAMRQAMAGVVGGTLIITMAEDVEFQAVLAALEDPQGDADLLALRREVMQRLVSANKDMRQQTGLSQPLIQTRLHLLCLNDVEPQSK